MEEDGEQARRSARPALLEDPLVRRVDLAGLAFALAAQVFGDADEAVGMVLGDEAAVGPFDVGVGGAGVEAEDLGVIADGIRQGRRVFANTTKYVQVTVSANFGNMLSMAFAAAALPFLPLLPRQILLLNFLSDIPGTTIAEPLGECGIFDDIVVNMVDVGEQTGET